MKRRYLNKEVKFEITKTESWLLLSVMTDDCEYIKERYCGYNKKQALSAFNKKHKYKT